MRIHPESSKQLRHPFLKKSTGPGFYQFAGFIERHISNNGSFFIDLHVKYADIIRRCRWCIGWETVLESFAHTPHDSKHQVLAVRFHQEQDIFVLNLGKEQITQFDLPGGVDMQFGLFDRDDPSAGM